MDRLMYGKNGTFVQKQNLLNPLLNSKRATSFGIENRKMYIDEFERGYMASFRAKNSPSPDKYSPNLNIF